MAKKRVRLNEAFPDWIMGNDVIHQLNSFDVPWKNQVDVDAIGLEYHGNVSGDKWVSPLVTKVTSADDGIVSPTEAALLAETIYNICKVNWNKQYATLSAQYDPIENYSMTETMTNDVTQDAYGHTLTRTDNTTHTKTGTETDAPNLTDSNTHTKTGTETDAPNLTDSNTHTKTGTEAKTLNLTDQTTPNLTTTNSNSVYGFNSSDAVPTGSASQQATGTDTTTHTGSDTMTFNTSESDSATHTGQNQRTYNTSESDSATHTGQNQRTYNTSDADTGTVTNAETGTDTHTRNYTLTRTGNIGVTTSQQMLESERQLWQWNFFANVLFPDLDKFLTLQIY